MKVKGFLKRLMTESIDDIINIVDENSGKIIETLTAASRDIYAMYVNQLEDKTLLQKEIIGFSVGIGHQKENLRIVYDLFVKIENS